jgi:hypothetical protein
MAYNSLLLKILKTVELLARMAMLQNASMYNKSEALDRDVQNRTGNQLNL